jgi:hypothetical protein
MCPLLATLFQSRVLSQIYKTVQEAPFEGPLIEFAQGFDNYNNANKAHEAAYDAYMTGVAMLRMTHYIGRKTTTILTLIKHL